MGSSFDTRISLSYFFRRVEKLSEDQRNAVKKVGFGHILEMHCQTLSKSLIVELIERWSCEKKAFLLPPGDVGIRLMDVALILGLRVTGEPVVLEEHLPFSSVEKEYGATKTVRSISVYDLEKRLESYKTGVTKYFVTEEKRTEDFVRTFLLFIFGAFLFPNDLGTVDSRYLYFLKDLDRIPQFAWGKVVREVLYEWMIKFKTDKKLRHMGSCLIFLQMWCFEHIDIARPNLPKGLLAFPRACRWQNNGSRPRKWFTNKFQELQHNQIVWKLEPTSEESNIDIIKDLLEKQNEICDLENNVSDEILCSKEEQFIDLENLEVGITGNCLNVHEDKIEILATSECCSNGSADLDDNVREVLCLEEQFIELEDLEHGITENSMKIQGDKIEILSTSECCSNDSTDLDDGLRAESSCSKEQTRALEDSEVAIIGKSLQVQEDKMGILSKAQCASSNHSAGQEKSSRVLKDKILDSKKCGELSEEIRTLKIENEELREQNGMLTTRLLSSEKLVEELREQNSVLTTRFLSSENILDDFEQLILLYDDTNGT